MFSSAMCSMSFNKTINGVFIGKIPIMVRSNACILQQIPGLGEENNNECIYDFGGYFIINGNEKVLISQDRINENKMQTIVRLEENHEQEKKHLQEAIEKAFVKERNKIDNEIMEKCN